MQRFQPKALIPFFCLLLAGCFQPSEKKITGTITIAPELKAQLSPDAALYVIARQSGSNAPAAVRKFPQPIVFPVEFQLLKQDLMFPDSALEGSFQVSARISQSGSATPVHPEDIESDSVQAQAEIKSPGVQIHLNRQAKSRLSTADGS